LNQDEKQLRAVRRIAEQVAHHLQADLSLKLWDGTVVPLGPGARDDILIAIRSPAAVRRMMLSPRLMTLVELYATGELDIEGGTLLDATRRWDHLRAVGLGRKLDKRLFLASLWPFLRAGTAGSAAAAEEYQGAVRDRPESGRDDKKLIQFHYDVRTPFMSSSSAERWSIRPAGSLRATRALTMRKLQSSTRSAAACA
jgi:cyclopropane-fatty-acyl-phospholipid synthase